MKDLLLKELIVYPIKSMKGINLKEVSLDKYGLELDRNWMLIDSNNKTITQREFPILSQFVVSIENNTIKITLNNTSISFPIESSDKKGEKILTKLHRETIECISHYPEVNSWLCDKLKIKVKLVSITKDFSRKLKSDDNYEVNLSDGDQILIISEESLSYLNEKISSPINMNRFRPNIVVSGCQAHEEDVWSYIKIGEVILERTKKCSRCIMVNVEQETGNTNQNVLKDLSKYRFVDTKIVFGSFYKIKEGKSKVIIQNDSFLPFN